MAEFDPAALAKELADEGGFSVSARGTRPRTGIMVSRVGNETKIPGMPTGEAIAQYAAHNAHVLAQPGRYMGGWVDDGDTYLDVSERFPVKGQQAQHALGGNQQIAGWDVARGQEVETWPQLFRTEENVPPMWPKHRRLDQIVGEAKRREQQRKMVEAQLRFPW